MFIGKNKHMNMLSAENVQSAKHQFSADDIFKIVFLFFSQETGFDISCTLSQLETVEISLFLYFYGKVVTGSLM